MEIDPVLPLLVGITVAVLCVVLILRQLRQPSVVGYIVVGILIGLFGDRLLGARELLGQFGNLGIVLLLFFIGMHISLPKLAARWRVAVIGTILQVLLTVGAVWGVSAWFGWDLGHVILLGFVLSLSSTAVVLKILADRGELDTRVGQNVLGILLVQDLIVIPMFLILGWLGEGNDHGNPWLQLAGFGLVLLLVIRTTWKRRMRLPFTRYVQKDHELQVFVAIFLCFSLALVTGAFGLSPALGAFVAGLIVASADATTWVQDRLDSFHVLFVALFFIYVGTLIDVRFVWDNLGHILAITLGAFVFNTLLNTLIIRFLGDTWRESFYAGVLLSQIGEFSFLLGTVGFELGIIQEYLYQVVVAVIALTLLFSPLWIALTRRFAHIDASYVFELPGKLHKALKELERNR